MEHGAQFPQPETPGPNWLSERPVMERGLRLHWPGTQGPALPGGCQPRKRGCASPVWIHKSWLAKGKPAVEEGTQLTQPGTTDPTSSGV